MSNQPPQGPPPGWGQQPPYAQPNYGPQFAAGPGWQPPYQPPKKPWYRQTWVIVVGVLIVLGVIGGAVGAGKKKNDADKSTPPPTASAPAPISQSSTAPAKSQPPARAAAPKVALDIKGSGIKNTQRFTVTADQWSIAYAFDCSNFGGSGNFAVDVSGDGDAADDLPVNELKPKDQSVSYENGAGTYSLEINSECDWHIIVRG